MKHEVFVFDSTTENNHTYYFKMLAKYISHLSHWHQYLVNKCVDVMFFFLCFLPQSCGDSISFNAGFQGVKGDAAQHLQRRRSMRTTDSSHLLQWINHPVFCAASSALKLPSSLPTCVCPLWNNAEPCSGLKRSTSQEMFLRSVSCLPSHLQDRGVKIPRAWRVQTQTRGATWSHLLYSFSTKLRKMSLLTVLKDSMNSKGSAWGNLSAWTNHDDTFSRQNNQK